MMINLINRRSVITQRNVINIVRIYMEMEILLISKRLTSVRVTMKIYDYMPSESNKSIVIKMIFIYSFPPVK